MGLGEVAKCTIGNKPSTTFTFASHASLLSLPSPLLLLQRAQHCRPRLLMLSPILRLSWTMRCAGSSWRVNILSLRVRLHDLRARLARPHLPRPSRRRRRKWPAALQHQTLIGCLHLRPPLPVPLWMSNDQAQYTAMVRRRQSTKMMLLSMRSSLARRHSSPRRRILP